MLRILAILMVICAFYLSSCTTTQNTNLIPPATKADSVTKKGFMQVSFGTRSFMIYDLTVRNSPVHTMTAGTMATDQNDTLWIAQIQIEDHLYKTISMTMTGYNNTSNAAIGTYMVRDNSSTLSDYSDGQNRIYSISIGSTFDITNTGFTTEGTLSLNLYYNHTYFPATGTFKIYN
jgi:hypothetical protein